MYTKITYKIMYFTHDILYIENAVHRQWGAQTTCVHRARTHRIIKKTNKNQLSDAWHMTHWWCAMLWEES